MSLPSIAQLEFPESDLVQTTARSTVHKTYAWDYNAGDFVKQDGKLIPLIGIDYVKAWCQKALRTVKGSLIYAGTNYGSGHHSLIGKNFNPAFSQAEYERFIREALIQNDAITRVDNFAFSQTGARLIISFDLYSIYGTTREEAAV